MSKHSFSFRNIPGWAVVLVVMGVLYFTGLHTEAIGQAQRLLLASGLRQAEVPDLRQAEVPDLRQAEVPEAKENSLSENKASAAFPEEGFSEAFSESFTMLNLQGETVQFEALKGKVIFLNIWATWCPPCIAEMPNIESLYKKIDADKIAFVMLSVDRAGLEKVKRFVDRKGFTFPVYMAASSLPEVFYTQSIPTTFIISPDGKIVHKQVGMAEYDTQEVREYLQALAR